MRRNRLPRYEIRAEWSLIPRGTSISVHRVHTRREAAFMARDMRAAHGCIQAEVFTIEEKLASDVQVLR